MSAVSSASAPGAAVAKAPRILACVLCQHRKIKCDKNSPCSNCVKANAQCIPSQPAPARKRRRPNQDLQERLARCEELLREYASGAKVPSSGSTPSEPRAWTPAVTAAQPSQTALPTQVPLSSARASPSQSPTSTAANSGAEPHESADPYGRVLPRPTLVKENGGVRFVDGFPWNHFYDELKAMRDILDADKDDEDSSSCTPEESTTPEPIAELLLGGSPSASLDDLHPEPAQVVRLWQTYLERVNPLTKVIHVPTLQPFVIEAAGASRGIPLNIEALLFAIFVMATISLDEDECVRLLGFEREEAIKRFSAGVRIALTKVGFLTSYDLVTLQALVIYQNSLIGRYDRHGAWIFNGLVIRIAQKMGLHRDGDYLGLSPFETEMRRRVWWQIVMLDAKYALISGLSHSLMPRSWDTKEPLNLDDADLIPNSAQPLKNKEGPTEMIYVLLSNQISKMLVKSHGLEYQIMQAPIVEYGQPSGQQWAQVRALMDEMVENMNDILKRYCDPATGGLLHELSMKFSALMRDKFYEIVCPPNEHAEWGTEILNGRDNMWKISVATTDHNLRTYKVVEHSQYFWFVKAHMQIDMLIYMMWELGRRGKGVIVDRAWAALDDIYRYNPELLQLSGKQNVMIGILVLRAWRMRSDTITAETGYPPPPPQYVRILQERMPAATGKHGDEIAELGIRVGNIAMAGGGTGTGTSSNRSSSSSSGGGGGGGGSGGGGNSSHRAGPVVTSASGLAAAANVVPAKQERQRQQEEPFPSLGLGTATPGQQPTDTLDQFFTGLLDVGLDWDMFGTGVPTPSQFPALGAGNTMYGMPGGSGPGW